MSSTRRLAAIMFSDIAGYTAMMQRDESYAIRRLRRYREVLKEQVEAHGGTILQHFGDGSLSIFDSAVEAAACACEMQRQFRQEPEVPLRIGLHVGDVVFEEGNIFGDGVNIASRVESLASPGAILITERVIYDLRNHPEFRPVSLGHFAFKNVSQPMQIYALSGEGLPVPNRKALRRKSDVAMPVEQPLFRRGWVVALAVGLVALVTGAIFYQQASRGNARPEIEMLPAPPLPPDPGELMGRDHRRSEVSIAVLPFEDLSSGGGQEYFGEGLAEEILNVLAQVEGLKVAGRTSSFAFKDKEADVREVGRKLGVGNVLEGSIRKVGNRVRVTAQLIDTRNGYHLWSQNFDREMDDIFAIQDEIAGAVVENLKGILLDRSRYRSSRSFTRNRQAFELFLRGRHMLNQRSEGAEKAADFFRQAIALDDSFAPAYAGLGNAYLWLGWNNALPSHEAFPAAERYARQALAIDGELAYAYVITGSVELWYHWNWAAARRDLERAISINASEARAYLDLGWYYAIAGSFDEAVAQIDRAIAIDPLNLEFNIDRADILRLARRYDQARKVAVEMRDLYPDNSDVYWILGMVDYSAGNYPTALTFFRRADELASGESWAGLHLVLGLARAGQPDEARQRLTLLEREARLAETATVELAMACLSLGEQNRALDLLERAYQLHANWLISLKTDPVWDELRKESRFRELLARMKFPE